MTHAESNLSRGSSPESQATLAIAVFILGPPAVGKMTVGQALARRTGFPLLHNHAVSDIVSPYFGSTMRQYAVTKALTELLVAELVRDYPGLILTRTHDFHDDLDAEMMQSLLGKLGPARRCYVELHAPLDVRLVRNRTENRLVNKPSKRDLVASEARVRTNDRRCFTPPGGVLPWPGPHLRLDNRELDPDEVAAQICGAFELPERPPQV